MIVQPQSQSQIYTLDQYRTLEETTEFRHEYHDGKISPMSGGTIAHNTIIVNLIFILKLALRGTSYRIHSSDLRLWIPQYRQATYPDIMAIAGEPILNENRPDEILNPCLIVEVLSIINSRVRSR
jgi:Uma2 family endonuclease